MNKDIIIRKLLRIFSTSINYLNFFGLLPSQKIKKPSSKPYIHIIGPPRIGSTVLYQLLASTGRFSYLTNYDHFFYSFSSLLNSSSSKIKFSQISNKSSNGFVKGIYSPSEANKFWLYWFDFSLVERDPKINKRKKEFALSLIRNRIDKDQTDAFLSSWNANAFYVDELIKISPNTIFIYLVRDPVDICISILKARIDTFGSIDKYWSMKPKGLIHSDPLRDVVQQAWLLHHKSLLSLKKMADQNKAFIRYKTLCIKPREVVKCLMKKCGAKISTTNLNKLPKSLNFSSGANFMCFRGEIEKITKNYDWSVNDIHFIAEKANY